MWRWEQEWSRKRSKTKVTNKQPRQVYEDEQMLKEIKEEKNGQKEFNEERQWEENKKCWLVIDHTDQMLINLASPFSSPCIF